MRRLAILLLALSTALAGSKDDPVRLRQNVIKKLAKEQRDYAKKQMKKDLRVALKWLTGNWYNMEGRADNPNVWVPNVRGYEKVYYKVGLTERTKGSEAVKIAETGDPRAYKFLAGELCTTLNTIVEMDKSLAVSKPKEMWWVHDQRPGVHRFGAMLYRRYLVSALAELKTATPRKCIREKLWKKAEAFDRKTRRDVGRIAVMDIWAKNGDPHVEALLRTLAQSEEPRIRIVALETLAFRGGAKKILRGHFVKALDDPCWAVRATAIDLLREQSDGLAIGPLADAFAKRKSLERARLHDALVHIAGKDLGWMAGTWQAWFKQYRERIEKGRWWSPKNKKTAADGPKVPTFDEIPVPSEKPLVIVDGNYIGNLPADIELAKTKNYWIWHNIKGRNRKWPTQWDVIKRETLGFVADLPEATRFNLLVMYGSGQMTPFPERGTIRVEPPIRDQAGKLRTKTIASLKSEKFLGKFTPDLGWCSAIRVIWKAYEMAGYDVWGTTLPDEPTVDTIILAADATASIGPLINLEATLLDMKRCNRFFRIPIHCFRVGYTEECDRLMEGIAEMTGGQYQWKKKP